jgi:hypothetical protein
MTCKASQLVEGDVIIMRHARYDVKAVNKANTAAGGHWNDVVLLEAQPQGSDSTYTFVLGRTDDATVVVS